MEDTSLLPKLDLPFYSEEDEESLRSLQIEMENISEITKKINQNNLYKSQLESIDIGLAKEFLSMNDYEDTSDLKQSLGELTSRASLENKMIKKYTDLQEMDQGRCPTCEQPVDYEFISTQLRNHISEKNSFVERIDAVKNSISRIENTNNTFTQMKEKVEGICDLDNVYGLFDGFDGAS